MWRYTYSTYNCNLLHLIMFLRLDILESTTFSPRPYNYISAENKILEK